MTGYTAPLRDMRFVLRELVGLGRLAALPGYEEVGEDLAEAILTEAGKFAGDVLAPLNRVGDTERCRWADGAVTMPPGFVDAYRRFVEGGWNALAGDPEFGGQNLPLTLAAAVEEMWNAANIAFALCPMLSRGAVEALALCGSDALKEIYLPKLVEGSWTGTMNLTESQAGSDLSAVRTRAVPEGDHYRISGQKIFISFGDHDQAENIAHLVLARRPDAPAGVKGISLFVVPKYMPDVDGKPGEANDLRCVSIEHKLGMHGSPTAIMAFGDKGGAIGYLVGEANRGLEYMFIMMNSARFAVGVQGLGIADRAYQQALAYAQTRVQGGEKGTSGSVPIIRHPDVRRMLLRMKALIEAERALIYVTAAELDTAKLHPDAAVRARAKTRAELLIPIVKAWATENANDITSAGVQVHGGLGFVEETGAAQHMRDARVLAIYEGTTGIQANDLLGRKIIRDRGEAARTLLAEMDRTAAKLTGNNPDLPPIRAGLEAGASALSDAIDWVLLTDAASPRATLAGAVPLLKLFGIVTGGWLMARAALAAEARLREEDSDAVFLTAKLKTARFYADHILAEARGLAHTVIHGSDATLGLDESQFAA